MSLTTAVCKTCGYRIVSDDPTLLYLGRPWICPECKQYNSGDEIIITGKSKKPQVQRFVVNVFHQEAPILNYVRVGMNWSNPKLYIL